MKKLIIHTTFVMLIIGMAFPIVSCKKDKLIDDLEIFKGRFTWKYTKYKEYWWSTNYLVRQASQSDYTAEVEFNAQGKIIFYIDGTELHKTGFSIVNKEVVDNGNQISLTIDPFVENVKNLNLNNEIGFSIAGDTLSVDDFPGQSYDEKIAGTHYFIRN